jgi:hypothetical protein
MSKKQQRKSVSRSATLTIPELEQSKAGRAQYACFCKLAAELCIRHRKGSSPSRFTIRILRAYSWPHKSVAPSPIGEPWGRQQCPPRFVRRSPQQAQELVAFVGAVLDGLHGVLHFERGVCDQERHPPLFYRGAAAKLPTFSPTPALSMSHKLDVSFLVFAGAMCTNCQLVALGDHGWVFL